MTPISKTDSFCPFMHHDYSPMKKMVQILFLHHALLLSLVGELYINIPIEHF